MPADHRLEALLGDQGAEASGIAGYILVEYPRVSMAILFAVLPIKHGDVPSLCLFARGYLDVQPFLNPYITGVWYGY